MNSKSTDNLADSASPIVRYSSIRYRVIIVIGLLIGALLLAYGIARDQTITLAAGGVYLVLVGLFTLGVRDKLQGDRVALARKGNLLVGGELDRPLPIPGTTFEIVSDHEGSWVVVLHHKGGAVRLGVGGWTVAGEHVVTQVVTERLLVALGLQRRTD